MEDARILVVDDQPVNRMILEEVLGEAYAVTAVGSGEAALAAMDQTGSGGSQVDLILLDVIMPGLDGFEVCRRLKATVATRDVPVLFLTSLDRSDDETLGFAVGAADFIHKPFAPPVVLARVATQLRLSRVTRELRERNGDLERLVAERTAEIRTQTAELVASKQQIIAAQAATISAFCALAEARDNETGNHVRRTQRYVRALAERLQSHPRFAAELSDEVVRLLFKSAPLHDVGKVAIPDAILLKPGKLTPEEWVIMKRHAEYGRDAIADAEKSLGDVDGSFLRFAREIAYCHHERWDGKGYPQGLLGDTIPLSARLMAVADVYDALISRRVYKEAFTHEVAVQLIREGHGSQFDPDVCDAFLAIHEQFRQIATEFSDDDGHV